MIAPLERIALVCAKPRTIAIADCVHFCGYRYGRDELNPYEAFALGLAEGRPLTEVRNDFVEYLRYYRPSDLGHALGIELSRSYPLWYLPWRTPRQVTTTNGWQQGTDGIVDVMTHFSPMGIPAVGLEREFAWHERAFEAICNEGYQPDTYGYVTVRELRQRGHTVYLVTDGNHRISALSALKHKSVRVKILLGTTINADAAKRWPLVRASMMTHFDALLVFNAYLSGNHKPARATVPATIVQPN